MKISILNKRKYEIAHHFDEKIQIYSKFNKIYIYDNNNNNNIIKLPINLFFKIIGLFRIVRRVLRLDKCVVSVTDHSYVIFWQYKVFYYEFEEKKLKESLSLINCRNPLHDSILVKNNVVIFGEYGKPHNIGKKIYKSNDYGLNWDVVYQFSPSDIRHVHTCKYDKFQNKVWIFTGDFTGECKILICDLDFTQIELIGDGGQNYRACNAFFEVDKVHWIMDSPLEKVYHIIYDRKTCTIEKGESFPGPVIYSKEFYNLNYLVCTVQEIGPSHEDNELHLFYSNDLKKWELVKKFRHDGLPKKHFKFGIGAFASGKQYVDEFPMFFEAVKKYDGKTLNLKLTQNED